MAIAFVQKKSSSANPANSLAATFDSSPTQGNLLLAFCTNDDGGGFSITGFTAGPTTSATGGPSCQLFTKIAGAGESSTITFSSTNSRLYLFIVEISGVSSATAEASNSANSGGSGVTTLALPSITSAGGAYFFAGEATGSDVTWGNTWTNSFARRDVLGRASCADRIVTTGTSSGTTETWTGGARGAGIIAAFTASSAPATNSRLFLVF